MAFLFVYVGFIGKSTGDTKLINNNGRAEVYQVSIILRNTSVNTCILY